MAVLVFVAYPHDDPAGTPLGVLTEATDKSVTVEEDGVGAGSCSINRHSEQAAWVSPGSYVRVYRDSMSGPLLAGWWVEEVTDTVLSPHEEGGEVRQASGRGPIACLEEAIVWHRALRSGSGRVEARRGRWRWTGGIQVAHPILRLLREARARHTLGFVDWDFGRDRDSAGARWPDETEVRTFVVTIGVTLLEAVTVGRAAELDITMGPDFTLHAWPEAGTDLSGSVAFTAGVDIRDTVELPRAGRRARSVALVGGERKSGAERYVAVRNATIEANLGRRKEGFKDYSKTATTKTLRRVGRRALKRWRRRRDGTMTLPVLDTPGQVALLDYGVSDTVTVTIPGVVDAGRRIISITLTETAAGEYDPVLEVVVP